MVSPTTGDHFRNRLTHTLEVAQIARDLARELQLNEDLAESLLDGTQSECCLDDCEGEDSWWLQGKRGECAVKMGYDGCEDEDEQGTVYIIPMLGREDELKLVEIVNR